MKFFSMLPATQTPQGTHKDQKNPSKFANPYRIRVILLQSAPHENSPNRIEKNPHRIEKNPNRINGLFNI